MSERVAAVDCGTNSIRLLVAEFDGQGGFAEVHRELRIVRLGEGVDATKQLNSAAVARTVAALHDYVDVMVAERVSRVRMVATSATRDASNREEFFTAAAAELARVVPGAVAEVITGEEEARLSFAGAVTELSPGDGPFVVVDLGGGSTEVVLGNRGGVQFAYSVDVGCVRMTERFLHDNPPTGEQVANARFFVAERFAQAFGVVPVGRARTWVGLAGTMTTLAAVTLDLPEYDPDRIHLTRLNLADVRRTCDLLIGMNHDQRAALGPMHPGRVDVIGGGAVVTRVLADELARRAGITELVVSEHDILDGIALSLVT